MGRSLPRADLRDKGLGIVPSGVAPHYNASVGDVYGQDFGSVQITASSAEDLIDRFITATYTKAERALHPATELRRPGQ